MFLRRSLRGGLVCYVDFVEMTSVASILVAFPFLLPLPNTLFSEYVFNTLSSGQLFFFHHQQPLQVLVRQIPISPDRQVLEQR